MMMYGTERLHISEDHDSGKDSCREGGEQGLAAWKQEPFHGAPQSCAAYHFSGERRSEI